jgi:hypothetical protein
LPEALGDVDSASLVNKTLSVVQGLSPAANLEVELVKVWVSLMQVANQPLSLEELQELMRLEACKSDGQGGFYRYAVTKVVSQAEVLHKTMPAT